MDLLDFTEEEIAEQLATLGYRNISTRSLREFKRDLDDLIQCSNWEELAPPPLVNAAKCQPAGRPSNPPAYTKEKVGRCYTDRSGEGFFLHKGEGNYDRECEEEKSSPGVPASFSFPSGDHARRRDPRDSYAQHSVAPKLRPPPGAPTRLQMKPHSEETSLDTSEPSETPELSEPSEPSEPPEPLYSPPHPDRYSSSPDGRRAVKRKVLRKRDGRSLVCDESVYSDDSDVTSCLGERLADLHVTSSPLPDSESEDADSYDSYVSNLGPPRREPEIRAHPKSYIRPILKPHGIKKSDPVTKYRQYADIWKMIKFPGERERRDIHQELQARLAYHPPPPRQRRVYVPNKYIVPTDKKRSALRWEIRNDLANGLVPQRLNCRY